MYLIFWISCNNYIPCRSMFGTSIIKNPKILVGETVRSTAVGTLRISQFSTRIPNPKSDYKKVDRLRSYGPYVYYEKVELKPRRSNTHFTLVLILVKLVVVLVLL
jgi:hypothetical protein